MFFEHLVCDFKNFLIVSNKNFSTKSSKKESTTLNRQSLYHVVRCISKIVSETTSHAMLQMVFVIISLIMQWIIQSKCTFSTFFWNTISHTIFKELIYQNLNCLLNFLKRINKLHIKLSPILKTEIAF